MTDSTGNDDLVGQIARSAQELGLSVAVAESLTCGLVASSLGKGEHAAEWFHGAVVAYSTQVKQSLLGVSPGPVVTEVCAKEMATGVRDLLDADITVSTTGVGGPDPEEGHASGTVHLGWSRADAHGSTEHRFSGDPDAVLDQSVRAALELLHRLLEADGPLP